MSNFPPAERLSMRRHSAPAFNWSQAQTGARAFSLASDPLKLLSGGMAAADLAVVLVSSAGAYLLRHGTVFPYEIAASTLLAAVLAINAMGLSGCYTRCVTKPVTIQVLRATQGCSAALVILVVLAYLTKTSDDFSRVWAITWYVGALVGVALVRVAAASLVRRWQERGKLARIVAIVDLAGSGDELARRLLHGSAGKMQLAGVFLAQPTAGRKNGIGDLIALSRLFRIDEVIVAVSGRRDDAVDATIRKLGIIPANVRVCPEMPKTAIVMRDAGIMFGQPVMTIYHRPLSGWSRVAKRLEDLVIGTVALVLVAPLMVLVAILIKLDSPGPVFFRQQRPGFNNNIIVVYKFRTMFHQQAPETQIRQAQRNDSRVTRIGRFLRRTSIDELPQIFNVLQGGMSLVGPRPHAIAHNDQYAALIDDYLGRHRVQPGITGWAQVNGLRGETETLDKMKARVEHDLVYIDSWSIFLDLRILFLTIFLPLFDRNAY